MFSCEICKVFKNTYFEEHNYIVKICRSSRPEVICKKGVNKSFTKFTGKRLCQSIFFNGHLEISASTSRHQHHHWNRHWHRHSKTFIFVFRNFFEKIEYACSFLCLIMVSVPLCDKYLFLCIFLFIHPKAHIGVLEKVYLSFRKHLSILLVF